MVVIAHKIIREFAFKHPDVYDALEDWYRKTCATEWRTITDVRGTFGYADYVGNDRIVFNIRGNHYRLIALVVFKKRTVFSALSVLTQSTTTSTLHKCNAKKL